MVTMNYGNKGMNLSTADPPVRFNLGYADGLIKSAIGHPQS